MPWTAEDVIDRVRDLLADTDSAGFFSDTYIAEYANDAQRFIASIARPERIKNLICSESKTITNGLSEYPDTNAILRLISVTSAGYPAMQVPESYVFHRSNYNAPPEAAMPLWKVSKSGTTAKAEFYPAHALLTNGAVFTYIRHPTVLLLTPSYNNSDLEDYWLDVVVWYCIWLGKTKEHDDQGAELASKNFKERFNIANGGETAV